jgi:sporulation protein YlmC with PRC-barrel domain
MVGRTVETVRSCMWGGIMAMVLGSSVIAPAAEPKADRQFLAIVSDSQGLETELKNVIFYWEEKISETSFVPHELRYFPVKRGTSTVSIKFETIKQVDVKSSDGKTSPAITITLTNGKTGEFVPAMNGSLRGESDFGQVEVPIQSITKIIFK